MDAVTFELPPERSETAAQLRKLEPQASRDLKPVVIQAAQELEAWRNLAKDVANQLEEVARIRMSVMASTSMVEEMQRGVRRTLDEAVRRLREMP
jgi:sugar-specific transcriptional regulator TrmB